MQEKECSFRQKMRKKGANGTIIQILLDTKRLLWYNKASMG